MDELFLHIKIQSEMAILEKNTFEINIYSNFNTKFLLFSRRLHGFLSSSFVTFHIFNQNYENKTQPKCCDAQKISLKQASQEKMHLLSEENNAYRQYSYTSLLLGIHQYNLEVDFLKAWSVSLGDSRGEGEGCHFILNYFFVPRIVKWL